MSKYFFELTQMIWEQIFLFDTWFYNTHVNYEFLAIYRLSQKLNTSYIPCSCSPHHITSHHITLVIIFLMQMFAIFAAEPNANPIRFIRFNQNVHWNRRFQCLITKYGLYFFKKKCFLDEVRTYQMNDNYCANQK